MTKKEPRLAGFLIGLPSLLWVLVMLFMVVYVMAVLFRMVRHLT